jgi:hypothetical protein
MMMDRQSLEQQVQQFFAELSILRISGGLDVPTTISRLAQAKAYSSITSLSCYRVDFTDVVTPHVLELLRCRRHWEILDLRSCHGQVDLVVDTILTRCVVDRLCLTDLEDLPRDTAAALSRGLVVASNNCNKTFVSQLYLNIPFSVETLQSMQDGLSQTTTLKELDLSGSKWQDTSVTSFGNLLRQNTSIEKLKFKRCQLQDLQIAELVQALAFHLNLTSLDLEHNACSTLTLRSLATLLRQQEFHHHQLSCLILSHHVLSEDRVPGLLEFLESIGSPACRLQDLTMDQYMLMDDDMIMLTESLQRSSSIARLSLTTCGITSRGIQSFAASLADMQGLRHLAMPGDAAHQLFEGLADNVFLQSLEFPPEFQNCPTEISYYLDLNRGGRRLLQEANVPRALWPLALARANQTKYIHGINRRADAIYCLLRGRVLLER